MSGSKGFQNDEVYEMVTVMLEQKTPTNFLVTYRTANAVLTRKAIRMFYIHIEGCPWYQMAFVDHAGNTDQVNVKVADIQSVKIEF